MRKVIPIFMVLAMVLVLSLTACQSAVNQDFVLVADSSAKAYLGDDCNGGLLKQFKDQYKICVKPVYKDSVEINSLQAAALSGKNTPGANAFMTEDGVWLNEKLVSPAKIAETNIVFGVDSQKAADLGWVAGSSHRIGDVADLMSSGQLKTVVCNANQCNAGAMFFTGIVNRLKGDTGNPPTMADFNNPTIIDAAKAFYQNVARSGASSDEAVQIYLQDKVNNSNLYNAIVLEEPIGAKLNQELQAAGRNTLVYFYLYDANTVSSPTMGYLDNGNADSKKIYTSLVTFLKDPTTQAQIAKTGWGSVSYGITPSTEILKSEWGFVTSPDVEYVPVPKSDVMLEAIRVYALYYKKPADIVMCLDNSGSMQDNGGFIGLKDAVGKITDLGWLANNQLFPSDKDSVSVYIFGQDIHGPAQVTGNNQDSLNSFRDNVDANMGNYGGTALYNCAKVALDAAMTNQKSDHNTVVVLMTDGQSNQGWERSQFLDYYKQTGTAIPIISIAFGSDASRELGYDSFGKYVNGLYFDGADLAGAFAKIWGGN